ATTDSRSPAAMDGCGRPNASPHPIAPSALSIATRVAYWPSRLMRRKWLAGESRLAGTLRIPPNRSAKGASRGKARRAEMRNVGLEFERFYKIAKAPCRQLAA